MGCALAQALSKALHPQCATFEPLPGLLRALHLREAPVEDRVIYFTSDTHFYHLNSKGRGIIDYCQRPFKNITDMNDRMAEMWNARVGVEDTVFHLGDFCFGSSETVVEMRRRLNGEIILIEGNHDSKRNALKAIGVTVRQSHFIEIGGVNLYLRHKPQYDTTKWPEGTHYHFHGHCHGKVGRKHHGRMIDVGVDCWNFKPMTLDEILAAPWPA